jgi:hypothetical protein
MYIYIMIPVISRYLPAVALMLLCACSSSDKEEAKNNLTDSAHVSAQAEIEKFFTKDISLPLTADTTLLFQFRNMDSLGHPQVKALSALVHKHALMEGCDWGIKEFCMIDSIKESGSYSKWCDSLDIGMTKSANAYALGRSRIDSSTSLLFWGIFTASYEACPFSSEWSLYFTMIHNNEITGSFILGDYVSAGDPPSLMTSTTKGTMKPDGSFSLDLKRVNEDMDEPELEITTEHYEFAIKAGKIELLSEKKDKPYKEKKPIVKE